jgi:hypothetical protein
MRSLNPRLSRRDVLRRLSLLAMAVPASGCYNIRAPFDPAIKTVYIPTFRTLSFRREIQFQLNELVIKEIEKRAGYKIVGTPEEADTILEGTINYSEKNIVVESPFNLPRQLTATIMATVKWTHNPPREYEKNVTPVMIAETVNFEPEIGEGTEAAFYHAAQNLATQIVDMMEQPW